MERKLRPRRHVGSGLLKQQLQLVDGKIAPIPDEVSFDKGFFLAIRACQLLCAELGSDRIVVVGVAGPSGAGKTDFTNKLSNFIPGIATISMDNYNDSSRVIDGNFDDPRIVDYDTLLSNINSLRGGNATDVPIYDFKLSKRVGYRRLEHPPSRILVVEGIFALSEKLRPVLDLRISITGGVHFDLVKRVLRDIDRAGQAPADIIHQISETVYPMYKAYIEPDLKTAQIRIVNKFNPFSGFQNPTYILKSCRQVSEEQIKQVFSSDYVESTENTYDIYLLPPGEDPETCQSYLRMRNRDGKYSLIFEELVTDNDFIISPRITFEVSVRLLGGLMALGYEMATILRRSSHVFSDDNLVVKIDQLEQVQHKYVQIQGKNRQLVADAGRKLGLEASYIPRSYIEQIQLEKLTADVVALPDDLKQKLSLEETTVPGSPRAHRAHRYQRSLSWSNRASSSQRKATPLWIDRLRTDNDDRGMDSPSGRDQGYFPRLIEQLASVNEKLDEVVSTISQIEGKITLPLLDSNRPSSVPDNSPFREEVRSLARSQVEMNSQLDILTNYIRQNKQQDFTFEREEATWLLPSAGALLLSAFGLALVAILRRKY